MISRLIEEKFPIREISELAIPERSSYKPIYQISKWFARRSSSTFRAILLSSILPSTVDLMKEFYAEHNFNNLTVIDPFMGGGTTIIESLRLGINCIGIDINPVAWLITKTEVEMVDLEELRQWIYDCEKKIKSKIKELYITNCPVCNNQADIIYAHWVKLLPCKTCNNYIPLFKNYLVAIKGKVSSILCPSCNSVFEHFNSVPSLLGCPNCQFQFNPMIGNRVGRNSCNCPTCGNKTNILDFLKKTQKHLAAKLYAIEGFCSNCANSHDPDSILKNTRFKFIKGVSKEDLDLFNQAKDEWNDLANKLPWPKGQIPQGTTTKTLYNHNYRNWTDMFNERQLLALGVIIRYIQQIPKENYQEMLLAVFINLLNHNNAFTRYSPKGQKVEGIFARHDFHPLSTFTENNVWGTKYGRGTWKKCLERLIKGKEYNYTPFNYYRTKDSKGKTGKKKVYSGKIEGKTISEYAEPFPDVNKNILLLCQDSENIKKFPLSVDLIISDPPYADNVNYSELSDFFYVWLRLVLKERYEWFSAKETPKADEAIISQNRPLNYYKKLIAIFNTAKTKLKSDGLLVFTFHHSDKQTWSKIAEVILKSGFKVVKTHAVPSEARNVLNIQKKKAIAFDLIIVCRKKLHRQLQTVTLEKFIKAFEMEYKNRLEIYSKANIKILGLDHLAIYYGILLEMDSKYRVKNHSDEYLNQNDIWETCNNLVAPKLEFLSGSEMVAQTNYELIIGDVLETLPLKAKDRLFNLIIADPPFGISFNKSSHEYGSADYDLYEDNFTPETYYQFSMKWIQTCYNALTSNGSLYIISGWTNLQYLLNAVEKTKFHLLNHAIWYFSWGVYTKRRFATSHYHILLLVKDKKNYQFYKQKHYDEDVFFWPEYNRGNDPHRIKGHPCQLPIALLEKLIKTSSSPKDLVGDVFSGSGGTILAARMNDRDVIGFEIRKEYESIIRQKARFGEPVFPLKSQSTLEKFI